MAQITGTAGHDDLRTNSKDDLDGELYDLLDVRTTEKAER